ncbi:MAG: ATP-binding protein [Candidatus Thermoplasmatota archaeon]|nr:ATP-binding protein [Candidatus Thermoplasmatota archaeon]
MLDKFIDREFELKTLRERYDSKKPEFLVIYGKRKISKTELVKQAFKGKPITHAPKHVLKCAMEHLNFRKIYNSNYDYYNHDSKVRK